MGNEYKVYESGKLIFFIKPPDKIFFVNNAYRPTQQTVLLKYKDNSIKNSKDMQFLMDMIAKGRVNDLSTLASICYPTIIWHHTEVKLC